VANSPDFVAHVLELARDAKPSARAMFGGHGIYVDGGIVGIVVDDVLYLKTDDVTRPRFVAEALEPFTFAKKSGVVEVTSYYRLPEDALESRDAMREWLRLAQGAALRASAKRRPTREPGKKTRAR
jgi:DNA transformation protein